MILKFLKYMNSVIIWKCSEMPKLELRWVLNACGTDMKDSICKNCYNNIILKIYTCTLVNIYAAKLIAYLYEIVASLLQYMNSFLLIIRPNN